MRTPGWTKDDETRETMPAPADSDAPARWASEFMRRASDIDHVLAILCADDFAMAGEL